MKKLFSILCVCAVAVSAAAMPARREGVVRTAADGSQKMVYLHGNAFNHYMTDESGNWLDENSLQPMSAEAKQARIAAGKARMAARRIQQQTKVGTEPNIAPRGLLIMVNFADKKFVTPRDTVDSMLNGANYTRHYDLNYDITYDIGWGQTYTTHVEETVIANGSARKYFQDQSFGQYNPQFDVVGPYTLSQNTAYYGKNDASGTDKHPDLMIKEACELADADGIDFTQYDNDHDGRVDFVYVLYAGEGEADGGASTTVWPHNWDLSYSQFCLVDGKEVCNYACSNEWQHYGQVYNGIGTFCHEFSHVMGLPDLYITEEGSSHHTMVDWDILDYGPYNNNGNTPPCYSAYERFFCGWITPRVLTEPENVHLGLINNTQEALLMCSGDAHNLVGYNPNPKTFYLLEVREKTGWDKYLPGRGMLITKIQYDSYKWEYNSVNNDANAMGVDLIEAKENTGDLGTASDAFPAGATFYTKFADHEITNIKRDLVDGSISFRYRGGWAEDVEQVNSESELSTKKVIRNGQVLIIRNGVTYDMTGKIIAL